jgi:hypothetical protein
MKILKEIKAVGLKNWLWFVFILKRNEFHPKLDTYHFSLKDIESGKVIKLRKLAHEIDEKISEIMFQS